MTQIRSAASNGALEDKYARVTAILRELESVAVAYSGGVDSALVLKVALDTLGSRRVVGVTGRSPSLPVDELAGARALAAAIGAEHVVLETDEFENPNYVSNPSNRCYFCKTTLYTRMGRFVTERGLRAIVNGVNADDLEEFRPGLRAADEHHVRAPAAEAGLTKADVRELARRLGLHVFDKPASPCLSSRVPYGEPVTPEKLRMIELAETYLRKLGFVPCRVRHHGSVARIEVAPEAIASLAQAEVAAQVDAYLRSLGYHYVALDLRGFRSGSLNEPLPLNILDPSIP